MENDLICKMPSAYCVHLFLEGRGRGFVCVEWGLDVWGKVGLGPVTLVWKCGMGV